MLMTRLIVAAVLFCSCLGLAWQSGILAGQKRMDKSAKALMLTSKKLVKFHSRMGPIQSGDWLKSHRESGQTFPEYVSEKPITLSKRRSILYVLPLGEFDKHQRKIIELSGQFMGLYFGCKVKILDTLSLENAKIPDRAKRVHPQWGMRQILSTYVLDSVLKPRLPKDAFALIAFTSNDLYPADDWNFVFGQASLRNRVGVWSIYRNGDAETEFDTCLMRTIKTATHETGHMFSIRHCTAYECNMCGSNNRGESDRRPVYLCPNCVAKVWYATKCDPIQRFKNLAKFCEDNGMKVEAAFYKSCVTALAPESDEYDK